METNCFPHLEGDRSPDLIPILIKPQAHVCTPMMGQNIYFPSSHIRQFKIGFFLGLNLIFYL
jgi:hypothetical protein